MCKILCIAGIAKTRIKALHKFMEASVEPLTANDPHGFGYAAVSASTGLYGERWLNPKDAFVVRQGMRAQDAPLLSHLSKAVQADVYYNSFGRATGEDIQAVILHGRYATCDISLANTHPFVRDNTALIHNGVIHNAYGLKNITSTCDSETILNEYVEAKVDYEPKHIQDVADSLQGYYACGILTQNTKNVWIMDVVKDNKASLYCTFVKELNTSVFCTDATILHTICAKARFTHGTIFKVQDNKLIRLEVSTGNCTHIIPFESEVYAENPGYEDYKKCQEGYEPISSINMSYEPRSDLGVRLLEEYRLKQKVKV